MLEFTPAGPAEDGGAVGATLSSPRPDLTLLTVRGEVDTLTSPQLTAALGELLAVPDGQLAVDLDGVSFLASSGLGALIDAAREAERRKRTLHVVATTRAVLRPLEVTGSDQLFTVVADLHGVPRTGGDPSSGG